MRGRRVSFVEIAADSGRREEEMPCLNLSTNVKLEGVDTSAILSEATSTVAKLVGKPEAYVMIVFKGSVPMSFGGTKQPTAYALENSSPEICIFNFGIWRQSFLSFFVHWTP